MIAKNSPLLDSKSPEILKIVEIMDSVNTQVIDITSKARLTAFIKGKFESIIDALKNITKGKKIDEQLLSEVMEVINQLMPSFRAKMLYRLPKVKEIKGYQELSLEEMFTHNIVLYERDHNAISGAFGGSCVNWAIFFEKLFKELEISDDIQIRYVQYETQGDHIALIIRSPKNCYIVDPFTRIGDSTARTVKKVSIGTHIRFLNDSVKVTQTHPQLKLEGIESTREYAGDILSEIDEKEYLSFITFRSQKKFGLNILHNNVEQKFIFSFEIGKKDIFFFVDTAYILEHIDEISQIHTSAELVKFVLKSEIEKKKYAHLDEIIEYICEKAPVGDILEYFLYKLA